ncbi:hypothetical protein BDF19DRAFT_411331 [Syncephalis fuscata]|nr:hypothetical protein BDF19DRAFT_411331 [Syncephalis fuscata]
MQYSIIAVFAAVTFAATTASAAAVVPCLHLKWKDTCQAECLKIGPNIQFNRCYDFNEANLLCQCNDQNLTSKILAMFKTPQSSQQTTSQKPPQAISPKKNNRNRKNKHTESVHRVCH